MENEKQLEYAFDAHIVKYLINSPLKPKYIKSNDIIDQLAHILVVDCRDEDYMGGNIKGSLHISDVEMRLRPVFHMLKILNSANEKNTKNIVFHCMESQIRGPKCAIKFKFFLDFINDSHSWNISILEGGFDQWVRKYYNNPNLVENFDIEYWPFVSSETGILF